MKTVIVDPGYIGVMHNAIVSVLSKNILCTIGGTSGYAGNVIPNGRAVSSTTQGTKNGRTVADNYKYMGKYNTSGKPDYLLTADDKLSAKLLSYINASLPENKSATALHPEYLKDNTTTNLNIVNSCSVSITFVHEGASYQNSLAYFTYPTKEPPKSASQIESLIMILPNASLSGSSGALNSGNKVSLGKFEPGISIGFCLISNGWSDKTQAVGPGLNKFYSIDALNPETKDCLKRHTLLLFEDTWPNTGDYDMNDLVVDYRYASILNAQNKTVELYANYATRASDATFKN